MTFVSNKIFLLVVIFAANLFSQNTLEQQFDFAKKILNQEKYYDAITELKRLQFFDKQNVFSFQSNILIGKSYKAGAKFDEAVKYLTLAEINAKSDE